MRRRIGEVKCHNKDARSCTQQAVDARCLGEGVTLVTDDQKIAYLLGMCQRVERQFTLREIVARVLDERPEMIMEFADTWDHLLRQKHIRVCKSGMPNTYEVVVVVN
jgi:hypothetical protein